MDGRHSLGTRGIDLRGLSALFLVGVVFFGMLGAGSVSAQPVLYAIDATTDALLTLDPTTGVATSQGSLGTGTLAGLDYDCESGLLLAVDALTSAFVTIDPHTLEVTEIGLTGVSLVHSIARRPEDGAIYAVTGDASSTLYQIDPLTAAATAIGPVGFDWIHGMDFDPVSGLLFACQGGPGGAHSLLVIDLMTGQGSAVGLTHRLNGLSFDGEGNLFGTENGSSGSVDSSLYSVNAMSGDWQLIGSTGFDNLLGLAYAECGGFSRGDVNGDGAFDVADSITVLAALFIPGSPPLSCPDAADLNDDGGADVSDAVYGLLALFVPGSPSPPSPYPDCGSDPTPDAQPSCASAACP